MIFFCEPHSSAFLPKEAYLTSKYSANFPMRYDSTATIVGKHNMLANGRALRMPHIHLSSCRTARIALASFPLLELLSFGSVRRLAAALDVRKERASHRHLHNARGLQ